METFPKVLSEHETLEIVIRDRVGMGRFGDGEIRLAVGPPAKPCKTQEHYPGLAEELRGLLAGNTKALMCLPRIRPGIPLYDKLWSKFLHKKWTGMIEPATYGSSFISRPESAPEINVPAYWKRVTDIWAGRYVTLVIGEPEEGRHYSLVPEDLPEALHVDLIMGPQRNAYARIDHIDGLIGHNQDRVVVLCLGTTATCLAERCAKRGVQAVDLGHIGRWVRNWRKAS